VGRPQTNEEQCLKFSNLRANDLSKTGHVHHFHPLK
jgi:hypothetical protein